MCSEVEGKSSVTRRRRRLPTAPPDQASAQKRSHPPPPGLVLGRRGWLSPVCALAGEEVGKPCHVPAGGQGNGQAPP